MEKVVILHNTLCLENKNAKSLNSELEQGWRVKSITTQCCKDFVTAIFVLEKHC